MQQNVKSATTAGLLGIFLGGFGAHNWYLGEKTKGIIHVCLMSGGILLEIICAAILPNVLSYSMLISFTGLLMVLAPIAGLCMSASSIWGLIEGIQILVGGDSGLAAKGYPVANLAPQQSHNNSAQAGYNYQEAGQPIGQPNPNQDYRQIAEQLPYQGQQYPGQNPNQSNPNLYQNPQYSPTQQTQAAPTIQPAKPPMDPAKKKKIAIIISVCAGAVIIGTITIILISTLSRVDYSSAYRLAKELKPEVEEIYYNDDCDDVVYDIDSEYVSQKTYDKHINGCLNVFSSGMNDKIIKLGETDGVKRNAEIKDKYSDFVAKYNTLTTGGSDNLETKLAAYKAWHDFIVAKADLSYGSSSNAEFATTANYLTDSDNETLAAYGSQWLERVTDVASAYRAYKNAAWSDSSDLLAVYNDKYDEFTDWIFDNKPDVKAIAPLDFSDISEMYTAFNVLYDMIAETYAENYNSESGDCTEFLGDVYCE